MPRRRKAENADLPRFVFATNGGDSYVYRHPLTGKAHGLGGDKSKAIERGNLLNDRIWGNDPFRLTVLRSGLQTCKDLIDQFEAYRRAKTKRDSTWSEHRWKLAKYRDWLQKHPSMITVSDLNQHLDAVPDDPYRKHKILLGELFEFARARGFIVATAPNPARLLLDRPGQEKRRQRLTPAWFWAIYDQAPAYLQCAMGISLVTSMRLGDIWSLRRDQFDARARSISYVPAKTRDNPNPMPTRCLLTDQQWARFVAPLLLQGGHESGRVFVYTDPKRPSRDFGRLSGVVTELPALQRPTFHEIRSLSEALYKRQGEDRSTTQRRMGHHSLKQTDGYDRGHDLVFEPVHCTLEV